MLVEQLLYYFRFFINFLHDIDHLSIKSPLAAGHLQPRRFPSLAPKLVSHEIPIFNLAVQL
jgi:hypothetical protein